MKQTGSHSTLCFAVLISGLSRRKVTSYATAPYWLKYDLHIPNTCYCFNCGLSVRNLPFIAFIHRSQIFGILHVIWMDANTNCQHFDWLCLNSLMNLTLPTLYVPPKCIFILINKESPEPELIYDGNLNSLANFITDQSWNKKITWWLTTIIVDASHSKENYDCIFMIIIILYELFWLVSFKSWILIKSLFGGSWLLARRWVLSKELVAFNRELTSRRALGGSLLGVTTSYMRVWVCLLLVQIPAQSFLTCHGNTGTGDPWSYPHTL